MRPLIALTLYISMESILPVLFTLFATALLLHASFFHVLLAWSIVLVPTFLCGQFLALFAQRLPAKQRDVDDFIANVHFACTIASAGAALGSTFIWYDTWPQILTDVARAPIVIIIGLAGTGAALYAVVAIQTLKDVLKTQDTHASGDASRCDRGSEPSMEQSPMQTLYYDVRRIWNQMPWFTLGTLVIIAVGAIWALAIVLGGPITQETVAQPAPTSEAPR